jgi:hypothetical protein
MTALTLPAAPQRNRPFKCQREDTHVSGLTSCRALNWWKPKQNPIFLLISNCTAPTRRSITSKPQTYTLITLCHPKQNIGHFSKRYHEFTLWLIIFDHDFLDLRDVINEQLDLFDAQAATLAANNSQSTLDENLPHRLKDVSRLQPDFPACSLLERRVCRNIDDFYVDITYC